MKNEQNWIEDLHLGVETVTKIWRKAEFLTHNYTKYKRWIVHHSRKFKRIIKIIQPVINHA